MKHICLIILTPITLLCLTIKEAKSSQSNEFPLVEITDCKNIKVDLEYKKNTNITGRALYPKGARAYLTPQALKMLQNAAKRLEAKGYGITVLDAWRPPLATARLWNKAFELGLKEFYCPPSLSGHTRGVAVDVTLHLINNPNTRIPMPTPFDSTNCTKKAPSELKENSKILKASMKSSGFVSNPKEWWHFELPNATSYPIIEGKIKRSMPKMVY